MENESSTVVVKEKISRKEAILKVGKYTTFTAAAMMLVLSPMDSYAKKNSPKPPRRIPIRKPGTP